MGKCLSVMLAMILFITQLSFSAQEIHADEDISDQSDIEVVYSSYNDLDLNYGLTDMTQVKDLSFSQDTSSEESDVTPIVVDSSITYQTWDGFGGSLDGASLYKINQLSEADQVSVLNDLFSKEGNDYDLMRLSIGCSDFTIDAPSAGDYGPYDESAGSGYWTYDDEVDEDSDDDGELDADFDLSNFSIQKDIDQGMIDLISKIQTINPDVKFYASMWSAPAWMKENQDIIWTEDEEDPYIRSDCYQVLADYYCKYIEAYASYGIAIEAVTLQNEPDIEVGYPCMLWTPSQQITFAKILQDDFDSHGLDVEIWGLDANEYETWSYGLPLLQDETTGDIIDALGYHNYGGIDMYYPDVLKEAFPDISYRVTEMTVGADKLIQYMRHEMNSYSYWITYYDIDIENQTYGPGPSFWSKPRSDDADHWSLSQVSDDGSGSYQLNSKYYVFGQFSRFIKSGSIRIASSEENGTIENVAFKNPDGSISLVVSNRTDSTTTNIDMDTPDQTIKVITSSGVFTDELPGDTIATYTWYPDDEGILDRQDWTMEASLTYEGFDAYQAIDDEFGTFWMSGENQTSGQAIIVDMKEAQTIDSVMMVNDGDYVDDYPGEYDIWVSQDKETWSLVGSYLGSSGISTSSFDECYARYVKISLTQDKDSWWTIQNLLIGDQGIETTMSAWEKPSTITDHTGWLVKSSIENGQETNAIDEDLSSLWQDTDGQVSGDTYFLLNMGQDNLISGISIDTGEDMWNYLERYQVYVWSQDEEAKLVAEGFGKEGTTRIYFEPQEAQYIWIKAVTTTSRNFTIGELNVYTPDEE